MYDNHISSYENFLKEGLFKRVFGGKKKEQEKQEDQPVVEKPFEINPDSDYAYLISVLEKAKSDASIKNLQVVEPKLSTKMDNPTVRIKFSMKTDKLKRFKKYLNDTMDYRVGFMFGDNLNLIYISVWETCNLIGEEWGPASVENNQSRYSDYSVSWNDGGYKLTFDYSSPNPGISRFGRNDELFFKLPVREALDSIFNILRDKLPFSNFDMSLEELFNKSKERYERDLHLNDIKSNEVKIKECFYDIMDISDSDDVDIEYGHHSFSVHFKIPGLKVNSKSESKYKYGNGGHVHFNIDWADFELNDTFLNVFSALSYIKPALMDIIHDKIKVDVLLRTNALSITVKL